MNDFRSVAAVVLMMAVMASCASAPKTRQLEAYKKKFGYRYELLENEDNGDDLFVILAFSGGGTRAAAFSYGVLEKLDKTTVRINGESRNLLGEVDVISSVSGGSFTAAYYALKGSAMLQPDSRFRTNFLYSNIESQLKWKVANPFNWIRLLSPWFGRIEIAQDLYQELLFGKQTYGDLPRRKPFLMVNATDMTKGNQFTFNQSQFDPICADLNTVPIARAVAASSNFPVAFSPLALNAYPGTCGYTEPGWVKNALHDVENNPRRYYRARNLKTYQESDRQYVHLLDGGISDNIGLRGPLTALRSNDPVWSLVNKINLEEIQKLVVIVVDAKTMSLPDYDSKRSAPGVVSVINSIATIPLDNYSADTVELLQDTLKQRATAQAQQPDLHQVELYRVYVGFDRIENEGERKKFLTIPTSFNLSRNQVDALRNKAGELLEQSTCFKALTSEAPVSKTTGCKF